MPFVATRPKQIRATCQSTMHGTEKLEPAASGHALIAIGA